MGVHGSVNMRKCDLCLRVLPMSQHWFFVTEGKSEPSEWRLAEHWCPDCMTALKELHAHT